MVGLNFFRQKLLYMLFFRYWNLKLRCLGILLLIRNRCCSCQANVSIVLWRIFVILLMPLILTAWRVRVSNRPLHFSFSLLFALSGFLRRLTFKNSLFWYCRSDWLRGLLLWVRAAVTCLSRIATVFLFLTDYYVIAAVVDLRVLKTPLLSFLAHCKGCIRVTALDFDVEVWVVAEGILFKFLRIFDLRS